MRNNATSFSRSGLSDWIVQRVSAVILAVYFVVMLVIWAGHPSYACWHGLMMNPAMKVFSLLSLLALASHAWVGLWTVLTDYVTTRHMGPRAVGVRMVLEFTFVLVIFVYLVWGIQILWG